MISSGSLTIRAVGALLLLPLAAGCSTGRWHCDRWSNDNGIHDGDRCRNIGWSSDALNGNRDHDGRWKPDRDSDGYFQGYSRDDTS
jgi:hypothetical protein